MKNIPNNLRFLRFNIFKGSFIFIKSYNGSCYNEVIVYTTVTSKRKIKCAIKELILQLNGCKFKKYIFKKSAASHSDLKDVKEIFASLVKDCENYCK